MPTSRVRLPGRAEAAGSTRSALDRRFEAAAFDWDGTAVPDRASDAGEVRELVEQLCAVGMEIVVVSGTHVGNVDGQLLARPEGPGHLHLCLNRGSEVFVVGPDGPSLVDVRTAAPEEEAALTSAAELTVSRLAERGFEAAIVAHRLNRRKIDLIPLPEWADPPKARIAELLTAVELRLRDSGLGGLPEVVDLALDAAREVGIADPRVTSDAKHVEIGLTDKSDSGRWIARYLADAGMGAGLVLLGGDEFGPLGGVAGSDSLLLVPELERATAVSVGVEPSGVPLGVEHLGGGPGAFRAILAGQLERRRRGDPPRADDDPTWSITVRGVDEATERTSAALLTLADGLVGTNGSPLLADAGSGAGALAAGCYEGTTASDGLLKGPSWDRFARQELDLSSLSRVLDLRAGLLAEVMTSERGSLRSARLVSMARPGVCAIRVRADADVLRPQAELSPRGRWEGSQDGEGAQFTVDSEVASISATTREHWTSRDGVEAMERIAAYAVGSPRDRTAQRAARELTGAAKKGFESILSEHRAAWGKRWAAADVVIAGDAALQRAVRFAMYHLISSVADSGEAAVGARGMTGSAYAGHVFWDADVFVLPFLAATHPAAARAMLEYRIRRLPAAQEAARALGRHGARFAWESAATGGDVTPRSARDLTGRLIPIRTGLLEEHITADVAWAACVYADWSGDDAFLRGEGLALVVETARYWASRIKSDGRGRGHIFGVIGPDEYHEPVDDDAFTNVMARWNLRKAAQLTEGGAVGVGESERLRWLEAAAALVDGYDSHTGRYEQCAGFYRLEPILIADLAQRPVTADALLGRERIRGTQVVKQADVLMLHHMVPDETAPRSLVPNLAYYEPRTAHGSSLSPGIHAGLFAREGMLDDAVRALDLAARMDLDDLSATAAGGMHLATMGSVWQALAWGFAGMRPAGAVLRMDPHVPESWGSMEIRVRFRGCPLVARFEPDQVALAPGGAMAVSVGEGAPPIRIGPGPVEFHLDEGRWRVSA